MIDLIVGGVGLGLLLSIMLGPVFFILLDTSIKKGIKSALFLDLGVLISDIMYISIAYYFVNFVAELQKGENASWLMIVGGVVFVVFGYLTMQKKKPKVKKNAIKPSDLKSNNYFTTVLKGFFLNAVNPGVLFYWLTIISTLRGKDNLFGLNENTTVVIYLFVILATFFGIDILKIVYANKLKNILTPAWLLIINRVLGIILICFGVIFVLKGILALNHQSLL
ncbi:MAG: LysE family translocator [Putridiphycobacter sp.]